MSHKAYAKVNIFLKITGIREQYHTLASRFMRVDSLYDEMEFIPNRSDAFLIEGDFGCSVQQNTIYKAYKALLEKTQSDALWEFFKTNGVGVQKRIPAFAGLGGGSSDAATFLHMCNEELSLGLTLQELVEIGMQVGADVPFFLYGYDSANVTGIGEIVEKFEEEPLDIKTFTPSIEISTPAVYKEYRKNFFAPVSQEEEQEWLALSSKEVLERYDAENANDLFAPALKLYGKLQKYKKEGWFFSGSGSSFFYV